MDIAALSVMAAQLVAKRFLHQVTDGAGDASWIALKRVAGRVRDLLARADDQSAIKAYERIEDSPDSEISTTALAEALKAACEVHPQFAYHLEKIVSEGMKNGAHSVVTIEQGGTGNVNNVNQVNFQVPDKPTGTPGRPLCPKCTSANVKKKKVFYGPGNEHLCRDCNTRF